MKLKILFKFALTVIFLLSFTTTTVYAQSFSTYYIREDGGTATQCTGLIDAAYPGSGTNQPCAWSHPSIALGTSSSCGNTAAKISGGDTVIIDNGSYTVGCGMPGAFSCASAGSGSTTCSMRPVPSGTPDNYTNIYGQNYASCSTKPELWGKEKVRYALDLTGAHYVDVECLEITDHDDCTAVNVTANKCKNTSPYGDWAQAGVKGTSMGNVLFKNLDIHGLEKGFWGSRVGNVDATNVDIKFNSVVGWDGDDGNTCDGQGCSAYSCGGTYKTCAQCTNQPGCTWNRDDYTGTITLDNVNVEYSGCAENYPVNGGPIYCASQDQGGYGDGMGSGDGSIGNWVVKNSSFSHNVSDGLDILHGNGDGTIKVSRSRFEGNAGNGLKGRASFFQVENSNLIGNCGYFNGQSFTTTRAQANPKFGNKSTCKGGAAGTTVFTGTGLNDAASGGAFNGDLTTAPTFTVVVDGTGSPNTFKWKKDSGPYTSSVPMSTSFTILQEGAQIKWAAAAGHTLNDQWTFTVIGCGFNNCRAGGNVLSVTPRPGATFNMYNSTVYSNGDVTLDFTAGGDPGDACNAGTNWNVKNSIIVGGDDWLDPGSDKTSYCYTDASGCSCLTKLTSSYNNIYGHKNNPTYCTTGMNHNSCTAPNFKDYATFPNDYKGSLMDATLSSASPALDTGDTSVVFLFGPDDFKGQSRGAFWDLGAFEASGLPPASQCGDGYIDSGEQCDDGNLISGDGCSDQCVREFCGDSIIQPGLNEVCDSNTRSCHMVDGYAGAQVCNFLCSGFSECSSLLFCGDRICSNPPETVVSCSQDCSDMCGDGIRSPNEQCDDGNVTSGDGCSDACLMEYCGDGVMQAGLGEQCDDGNVVSGDGCSASCFIEYCGDGVCGQSEDYTSCPQDCTPANINFSLMLSYVANRVSPVPLSGQVELGNIYVFISPANGIKQVKFYLDDPNRAGLPKQIENAAPYDFAGTAAGGIANPYNVAQLPAGTHNITASLTLVDGTTKVISANFIVGNPLPVCGNAVLETGEQCDDGNIISGDGCSNLCRTEYCGDGILQSALGEQCDDGNKTSGDGCSSSCQIEAQPFQLMLSLAANRSGAVPLSGQTAVGNIYVFIAPENGVRQVRFYLDDPNRVGLPKQTENAVPYDFAGTASNGTAKPYDVTRLPGGVHSITAAVTLMDGSVKVASANFRR